MSAGEIAREIGELRRRIESLETAKRTASPEPSATLFGLLRSTADASVRVQSVLSGGTPEGIAPYPVVGSAVILTDESGYFQISTPFRNGLLGVWCASADTAVFAGHIGIADRDRKVGGLHAPVLRCHVGGAPTAQVYVHACWIAYGA